MDRKVYFKQNDRVLWRWLFIWACDTLSILKALHISVWEMAISHRNGWRRWANAKCACAWRQLGDKNKMSNLKVLFRLRHDNLQKIQFWLTCSQNPVRLSVVDRQAPMTKCVVRDDFNPPAAADSLLSNALALKHICYHLNNVYTHRWAVLKPCYREKRQTTSSCM